MVDCGIFIILSIGFPLLSNICCLHLEPQQELSLMFFVKYIRTANINYIPPNNTLISVVSILNYYNIFF